MSRKYLTIITAAILVAGVCGSSFAALLERSNGLIYDSDLNITYYDYTYVSSNWSDASNWANNLVYGGYDDWRLPNGPIDQNYQFYNSCAFKPYFGSDPNINDRGWYKAASELGHLFYEELNGIGMWKEESSPPADTCDESTPNQTYGLVNGSGPFQNLLAQTYWTSTPWSSHHWVFGFGNGGQGTSVSFVQGFAIAVRDGDVAHACVQPPSGMISWWDADSVSGATATDIQGSHDGTLVNGATTVPGKVGDAFSFDGVNDYVVASARLDTAEDYSVDFWIKPRFFRESPIAIIMRSGGTWTLNQFEFMVHLAGTQTWGVGKDRIQFQVAYPTTAGITSWIKLIGPTIPEGDWTHIASTYDAGSLEVKLYVNGALVDSKDVTQELTTSLDSHVSFLPNTTHVYPKRMCRCLFPNHGIGMFSLSKPAALSNGL